MKSSKAPLRDRCFFRRSVRYIVMHSRPYRSLSLSLKIEPFLQRARGPKYSFPSPSFSFSIGQCLNDYSNEAHDREALTFVFYSAFIRIWQLRVTQVGLTFTHFFRAVFWGDATREQLGLSRFSPTIVRNVPKSAQSSGQYFKTHCELSTKLRA